MFSVNVYSVLSGKVRIPTPSAQQTNAKTAQPQEPDYGLRFTGEKTKDGFERQAVEPSHSTIVGVRTRSKAKLNEESEHKEVEAPSTAAVKAKKQKPLPASAHTMRTRSHRTTTDIAENAPLYCFENLDQIGLENLG